MKPCGSGTRLRGRPARTHGRCPTYDVRPPATARACWWKRAPTSTITTRAPASRRSILRRDACATSRRSRTRAPALPSGASHPTERLSRSGQFAWGGGDQVTLLRLATGEKRIVQLKNFKNLSEIAWAPDGRSLFGTTGTLLGGQVLHIGLDGTTQLLHMFESQIVGNPRPSPDGRLLLVGATSNAWVLELR